MWTRAVTQWNELDSCTTFLFSSVPDYRRNVQVTPRLEADVSREVERNMEQETVEESLPGDMSDEQ